MKTKKMKIELGKHDDQLMALCPTDRPVLHLSWIIQLYFNVTSPGHLISMKARTNWLFPMYVQLC